MSLPEIDFVISVLRTKKDQLEAHSFLAQQQLLRQIFHFPSSAVAPQVSYSFSQLSSSFLGKLFIVLALQQLFRQIIHSQLSSSSSGKLFIFLAPQVDYLFLAQQQLLRQIIYSQLLSSSFSGRLFIPNSAGGSQVDYLFLAQQQLLRQIIHSQLISSFSGRD